MIGRGAQNNWYGLSLGQTLTLNSMSMEEYYRLNPSARPVRMNRNDQYDIDTIIDNHPQAYPVRYNRNARFDIDEIANHPQAYPIYEQDESDDDLDTYGTYSYELNFAPARSTRYPFSRSRSQSTRNSIEIPVSRGTSTRGNRNQAMSSTRLSSVGGSQSWRTVMSVENLYDALFEETKVAVEQKPPGLTSEEIRKIKKTKTASVKDTCSICCSNFKSGESVSVLPCTHSYHDPCILPWLKEHKTCPMCRQDVIEGLAKEAQMKKTKPPLPTTKTTSTLISKGIVGSKKPLSYTSREGRENITAKKMSKR